MDKHKGAFSYSGRGMYGKSCLAFRHLRDLLAAIRADTTLPLTGWQEDSLGRGSVYYHEDVDAPPAEDEDCEDED